MLKNWNEMQDERIDRIVEEKYSTDKNTKYNEEILYFLHTA